MSQDSIDSMETNTSVLHASSIDQYYTTQEVMMPSLPSITPFLSDVNAYSANPSITNTNLDEPPSAHQGVLVKIMKPIHAGQSQESLLQSHRKERKDRETAMLLLNGVDTNLIGRMLVVC